MQIEQNVFFIAIYLLAINITAFLTFAWDKHCAQNGMWRVRESTLLLMSAIGGTIGSMIGQSVLRHKTYKQPFGTYLYVIAFIQVFVLVALLIPNVRQILYTVFFG